MFKQSIFWQHHPALLLGVLATMSAFLAFGHLWALLPSLILFLTVHQKKLFWFFFLILAYTPLLYQFPTQVEETAIFSIESVSRSEKGGFLYRGKISSSHSRNVPVRIFAKKYYSQGTYQVQGKWQKRRGYQFKVKGEWELQPAPWSSASLRYALKERVRLWIASHYPEKRVSHFLSGLTIGELGDSFLWKEFGDLGLAHIMAISGFHFSLIAAFFFFFLRFFLPYKLSIGVLMALLTSYMLFLGNTPSIQRAWLSAMVFLFGELIQRESRPLNSLGVALLVAILLDPLVSQNLGFQLSFLATFSLLLIYPACLELFYKWMPPLAFETVSKKRLGVQYLYIVQQIFHKGVVLACAIQLTLSPLLLYLFHRLPMNGLIYNLFFPFLVSVSMLLFLVASCLPFLGSSLHRLNGAYTGWILSFLETPPLQLPWVYVESLPVWGVTLFLTVLFWGATGFYVRSNAKD